MATYKVSKECANCGNVDDHYLTKEETAFWLFGDINKKECSGCGSLKSNRTSYPSVEVDDELIKKWGTDNSLYFLSQDEEIFLGEKRYADLLIRFLDDPDFLPRKKEILTEALYVIIFDIADDLAAYPMLTNVFRFEPEKKETQEEQAEKMQVLQKVKDALLARKYLIKQVDNYVFDYLKEVVYPVLGLKFEMMKIKVCGMTDPKNIQELAKLPVNYIGLIFYPKSPRYISNLDPAILDVLPATIKRTGVFVNEALESLLEKVTTYQLQYIQLHGNESVAYCEELQKKDPEQYIIKAFNIAEPADFLQTEPYKNICSYFLFDTKTPQHGGSGKKFDWSILKEYKGDVPFFLSGGISVNDVAEIRNITHPKLYALDLNSKFEIQPGLKNIDLLKQFIKNLRNEQN